MALDFDQPKESELFVKYIYDDMDRLILRNVYQFNTGARNLMKRLNWSGNNTTLKDPKKLLYQDIYRYGNSQDPNMVRRVYQPVITPPTGTRDGSNLSFTSSFTCRSNVLTYGFIWNGVKDALMMWAQYPDYNLFKNEIGGVLADGRRVLFGDRGLGQLTHTLTYGSTLYIKAFCMIETGILFSKTLTL